MSEAENTGPIMDPDELSEVQTEPETMDDSEIDELQSGAKDTPHAGYLHVVFHGLFCYFEDEMDILVRTPRVTHMGGQMAGSEHVYLAGNWLGEVTYPPRKDYRLKGVRPGYARFRRDVNLYLSGGTMAQNNPGIYAEFRFPYPMQIHSLQRLSVLPLNKFFSGDGVKMIQDVKAMSTIQIFTYRFDNHLKLELPGTHWSANNMLSGNIATLHLWAEPDQAVPKHHVTNAFSNAITMFDKVDLTLTNPEKSDPVRADDLPFGTCVQEMVDLFLRVQDLAKLGKSIKNGRPLQDPFQPSPFLTGHDALRCGHIIGGVS